MPTEEIKSNWTGSLKTYQNVKQQILDRFGHKAAEEYSAINNCLTYKEWQKHGYSVNSGARSLKSIVIIEKKDKTGKVIKKYPKTICLFFKTQVHKTV